MIVNYYPGGTINRLGAPVKYTGTFFVKIDESNQSNWECHLLTNGTLTVTKDVDVDIFLVGGGGGGGSNITGSASNPHWPSGGGGGRTHTESNVQLARNATYTATIGAGGAKGSDVGSEGESGGATALVGGTINLSVAGGGGGGGTRASGGRAGGIGGYRFFNAGDLQSTQGAEGGRPAVNVSETYPNSFSLDEKVSAFWEDGATPYAGGGAGGGYIDGSGFNSSIGSVGGPVGNYGGEGGGGASCHDGLPNTGGGGGGAYSRGTNVSEYLRAGNGGSGIIIIRNHRT